MKIPVLPISYADAQPFLANLEGPVAPEPWRGALPVTYHIGPGPATARLKVDNDSETRPLYNVIATIPGSEVRRTNGYFTGIITTHGSMAPTILSVAQSSYWRRRGRYPSSGRRVGNQSGPSSSRYGTRKSSALSDPRNGWRSTSGNSTEKLVAYFNSDTNGKGQFSAGGSPSMYVFMREIVRDVLKPEKLEFTMPPVGSGSDYTPFLHHAGIASVNAGFGDSGGVYHSIYDSFDWYTVSRTRTSAMEKPWPKSCAPRLCAWPMRRFSLSSSRTSRSHSGLPCRSEQTQRIEADGPSCRSGQAPIRRRDV